MANSAGLGDGDAHFRGHRYVGDVVEGGGVVVGVEVRVDDVEAPRDARARAVVVVVVAVVGVVEIGALLAWVGWVRGLW